MIFLTEPEPPRGVAVPVLPGIRRVVAPNPGPMTYWGTNTYLIDAPGGVLVLDPGPDDGRHVQDVLAAASAPVAGILLSHSHHDHLGAVAALREATGAPVHAWHRPAAPGFTPDTPLSDGDRVGAWQAIHTPGHAPDHLCFAGPNGVLFSADHVMSWSSSVVGPPGGSMQEYFASLHRLLARDDRWYLPGHGPPLPDPASFTRALLDHRLMREAAILDQLGEQPRTARALTDLLYSDLDNALRRAAERNVTAHLAKLAAEGRAREAASGWTAAPQGSEGNTISVAPFGGL